MIKCRKIGKKKMAIGIALALVFVFAATLSLVYVLAAQTQNVSSSISITYISDNVSAEVGAKYWVSGENKINLGNTLFDAIDESRIQNLDFSEPIRLTTSNNKIVLEYSFKNISNYAAFTIELMDSPRLTPGTLNSNYKNVTEKYFVSSVNRRIDEFDSLNWQDSINIQPVMKQRFGEEDTLYIYVMASINNLSFDANYTGQFVWELNYLSPSNIQTVTCVVDNGETTEEGEIEVAITGEQSIKNMPAIFQMPLANNDSGVNSTCHSLGIFDSNDNKLVSADGSPVRAYSNEETIYAKYQDRACHEYVYNTTTNKYVCSSCGHELELPVSTGLVIENGVLKGKGTCTDEIIVVPYGVTSLGTNAFYNTNIKGIILPQTVTEIGDASLRKTKITSLYMPNSVIKIGNMALLQNPSLTDLIFSENLTTIGQQSIVYIGVRELVIPDSVTSIGMGAFGMCPNLKSVIFPNKDISFGKEVFFQCTKLESVVLPDVMETIPQGMFGKCSKLTTVSTPSNLKTIGQQAFMECTALTSFNMGNGLVNIGKMAFNKCSSLREIVLPNTVEEIGSTAFQSCTALTSINLPSSLKFIGDFAFNHCSALNLTTITIPASVVQIGGENFVGDNESNNIVGSHVFYDCATTTLTQFAVEEGNTHFVAKDGVLYTKNYKYLVAYPPANTRTSYEIEEGCQLLYELSISRPQYLKTLTIPNSLLILSSSALPSNFINKGNSLDCGIYHFDVINEYVVKSDNPNYKSIDGIIYSKDGTRLISVPTQKWDENHVLTFADSMTTIDDYLKEQYVTLTINGVQTSGVPSIILLGSNVTNISQNVFSVYFTEGPVKNSVKIFTTLTERPSGWASNLGVSEDHIYYFSATQKSGNYWHYVDDVPTLWN